MEVEVREGGELVATLTWQPHEILKSHRGGLPYGVRLFILWVPQF